MENLKEADSRHKSINDAVKGKLQKDKDDLNAKLEYQAEEIEALKCRADSKLTDIEKLLEETTTAKKTAVKDNESLKVEILELKEEMRRLNLENQNKIKNLNEEVSQLQDAKKRLDDLTESLKQQLLSRPVAAESENAQLEAQNRKLESDLR